MTQDFPEAMQAAYESDVRDQGLEITRPTDFADVAEQRGHDEEFVWGALAVEDYTDTYREA